MTKADSEIQKSLKNFTTIREALNSGDWTPRGLRIVFLMHSWSDGIEVNEGSKEKGSSWEEKLNVSRSALIASAQTNFA